MYSPTSIFLFFCLIYACQCKKGDHEMDVFEEMIRVLMEAITEKLLSLEKHEEDDVDARKQSKEDDEESLEFASSKTEEGESSRPHTLMISPVDVYKKMIIEKIPICSEENLNEYKNVLSKLSSRRKLRIPLKHWTRGNKAEQRILLDSVPLCLIEKDVMLYILNHWPDQNQVGTKRRKHF
ncbi:unnamed protein product [Nezara viridula]|uniref:Neuropeptide n=1 Tax=Nezara viridula TaxID=85310 RepID=A0A9P0HF94_NEZVI|nr:unnamed protein product [Nezara viridula]